MKTKIILISISLLLAFQAGARGSETGNGGAAVVCRDPAGKISRVDLLDLFEGFALFGRGYRELPAPAAEQARAFVPTLDQLFFGKGPQSLGSELESIITNLKLLPDGVALTPTEDWGNFIAPKQCSIEQAVNFRDDGDLFADAEIWNRYSQTQKAAAYIHELIYDYARQNGEEETSIRVRTLVSLLFAGVPLDSVIPSNVGEFCEGAENAFYTRPTTDKKIELFFTKLRGHAALSRITAVSPANFGWPLADENRPDFQFESRLDSLIDRGISIGVTRTGQNLELVVKMGSEKTTNTLKCEKLTTKK